MGGWAAYEAGQEEDLRRAQKILATPNDIIESRLRAAKVVVACFSHESFKSRWCKSEWRLGLELRTLVPLAIDRIERVEIPIEFNGLHYSDFSAYLGTTTEPCFQDLLRAIRRHIRT